MLLKKSRAVTVTPKELPAVTLAGAETINCAASAAATPIVAARKTAVDGVGDRDRLRSGGFQRRRKTCRVLLSMWHWQALLLEHHCL